MPPFSYLRRQAQGRERRAAGRRGVSRAAVVACVLSAPYRLRLLFASRPEVMCRVLGIVCRCIATHLIKKAGLSRRMAQTGAVTLIRRFGSVVNLNVHFHVLFLDGVY